MIPAGPPPPRPIRARAVWSGVGLAVLGHLLVAGLLAVVLWATGDGLGQLFIGGSLLGQLVLFATVTTAGTVLIVKGDRGLGLGLFIGWAAGLIVLPVVGFGICVAAISAS
ncbi:hypothetical protein GCM10020358_19220 [Amorphoplanes nipponensis]|uniref:Uncharacterized protein n=1 Tax=Actinoplanes nipponensis TaxID=135950 RepID=A0A919JH51_9ACTN|nr:hypothetical protein [Actinoplanes nipponensis]GIE49285.1 hypothetical protein Ani05nite_28190 [Actinoplanes nipponensis]